MEPFGSENNLEEAFGATEETSSLNNEEEIVTHEQMDDVDDDF